MENLYGKCKISIETITAVEQNRNRNPVICRQLQSPPSLLLMRMGGGVDANFKKILSISDDRELVTKKTKQSLHLCIFVKILFKSHLFNYNTL